MLWKRKLKLEEIMGATSKYELKMQCLAAARGNVKEAAELYEFLTSDELPELPVAKQNFYQQLKNEAGSLLQFCRENRDEIEQLVAFVQNLRKPPTGGPSAALPELPKIE